MITPICKRCGHELMGFGAIIISEPQKDAPELVQKWHICVECVPSMKEWIEEVVAERAKYDEVTPSPENPIRASDNFSEYDRYTMQPVHNAWIGLRRPLPSVRFYRLRQ